MARRFWDLWRSTSESAIEEGLHLKHLHEYTRSLFAFRNEGTPEAKARTEETQARIYELVGRHANFCSGVKANPWHPFANEAQHTAFTAAGKYSDNLTQWKARLHDLRRVTGELEKPVRGVAHGRRNRGVKKVATDESIMGLVDLVPTYVGPTRAFRGRCFRIRCVRRTVFVVGCHSKASRSPQRYCRS